MTLFTDTPKKPSIKTADVMAALRAKYVGKTEAEWAGGFYLEECGINGTTARDTRCDALYAGFTAASGRTLIGHEVKVSRSDWLAELAKVGKADWWFDNTHQWYLVAPTGVLRDEELPHGWGHMEVQGSRLVIKTKAPVRDVTPSWDALRSILSRAETLRAQSVQRARTDARTDVQSEINELQNQLREAQVSGGQGQGELSDMIRWIVFQLQAQTYQLPDRERVLAALTDLRELERANEWLRHNIEQSVRALNSIAIDAKKTYNPKLREIADGLSVRAEVTA